MAFPSPVQIEALKTVSPRRAVFAILAASVAALGLLFVVIFGHGRATQIPRWISYLPALNAGFNATSAVFLLLAYRLRHVNPASHARHMIAALAASTLFLVCYIVYHSVHGDTRFQGQGAIRPLYFFILISHVTLSGVALPLIFSSFYFALSGRIGQHRKVARYTFPVWLYVSTTGVLVFLLLRAYGP